MGKSRKKKHQNRPDDVEAEEVSIITLTDEDGNTSEYEYLETIEYKDKEYCVLYPNTGREHEDFISCEVVSEPGSNEATYKGVESEKVMNKVFEIFKNN